MRGMSRRVAWTRSRSVAIAARARCASRARERDHGRPATEPRRAGARRTHRPGARAVPLGETAAADVGGARRRRHRARAPSLHGAPPASSDSDSSRCGNIAPAQNLNSTPSTTARFGSSSPRRRTTSHPSAPARKDEDEEISAGVVFPIVVFGSLGRLGRRARVGRASASPRGPSRDARVKDAFLPSAESVTADYWDYARFRFVQRAASSCITVFATQQMLQAVGLGATRRLPAAAAVNWVLKDGLGRLGKLSVATNFGREFDSDVKRFRFTSSVVYDCSSFVEMITPFFPRRFLLLATVANVGKSVGITTANVVRAPIQRSFALEENLAEITAKTSAQQVLADNIGLAAAVAATGFTARLPDPRLRLALPLVAFAPLAAVDLYCIYRELKSVQLRTVNKERGEIIAEGFVRDGGRVPCARRVADAERLLIPARLDESSLPLKITGLGEACPTRALAAALADVRGDCRRRRRKSSCPGDARVRALVPVRGPATPRIVRRARRAHREVGGSNPVVVVVRRRRFVENGDEERNSSPAHERSRVSRVIFARDEPGRHAGGASGGALTRASVPRRSGRRGGARVGHLGVAASRGSDLDAFMDELAREGWQVAGEGVAELGGTVPYTVDGDLTAALVGASEKDTDGRDGAGGEERTRDERRERRGTRKETRWEGDEYRRYRGETAEISSTRAAKRPRDYRRRTRRTRRGSKSRLPFERTRRTGRACSSSLRLSAISHPARLSRAFVIVRARGAFDRGGRLRRLRARRAATRALFRAFYRAFGVPRRVRHHLFVPVEGFARLRLRRLRRRLRLSRRLRSPPRVVPLPRARRVLLVHAQRRQHRDGGGGGGCRLRSSRRRRGAFGGGRRGPSRAFAAAARSRNRRARSR